MELQQNYFMARKTGPFNTEYEDQMWELSEGDSMKMPSYQYNKPITMTR